jgi:hypothetical protein
VNNNPEVYLELTCKRCGKTQVSGSCPFCQMPRTLANTEVGLRLLMLAAGSGDAEVPPRCACDESNRLISAGLSLCDVVTSLMADWDELDDTDIPDEALVSDIYFGELRQIRNELSKFQRLATRLLAQHASAPKTTGS